MVPTFFGFKLRFKYVGIHLNRNKRKSCSSQIMIMHNNYMQYNVE